MVSRGIRLAIAVSALALGLAQGVDAQGAPAGGGRIASSDWPEYNRTVTGERFSPLTQIRRDNVKQLKVLCSYELPEVSAFQTGPIVVNGTMYFTTQLGSYALDASTCQLKWMQHLDSDTSSALGANRGFYGPAARSTTASWFTGCPRGTRRGLAR
jgi:alcohol dehydrogenase (cytochrome c)